MEENHINIYDVPVLKLILLQLRYDMNSSHINFERPEGTYSNHGVIETFMYIKQINSARWKKIHVEVKDWGRTYSLNSLTEKRKQSSQSGTAASLMSKVCGLIRRISRSYGNKHVRVGQEFCVGWPKFRAMLWNIVRWTTASFNSYMGRSFNLQKLPCIE